MKICSFKNRSVRSVAHVISFLVSSFPAVEFAEMHYWYFELDNICAHRDNKGNFDSIMTLTTPSRAELTWWVNNVPHASKAMETLTSCSPLMHLGWGAVCGNNSTGGLWSLEEQRNHINYLELKETRQNGPCRRRPLMPYMIGGVHLTLTCLPPDLIFRSLNMSHGDLILEHIKLMLFPWTGNIIFMSSHPCHCQLPAEDPTRPINRAPHCFTLDNTTLVYASTEPSNRLPLSTSPVGHSSSPASQQAVAIDSL